VSVADEAAVAEPVRIAMLGAGRIGRMHAGLLVHSVPGAALACVYDVVAPAATSLAESLGAPAAASVEEVLSSPDVDAVAICTSTDTHAWLLGASAAAGKAIFCEKPVSLDLAATDVALAEVVNAGVPLQIGFNRRFDPSHRAVRDAVADGVIGDVHLVRITSRDPTPPPIAYIEVSGGLFLDMTIHDFDMARFVAGSEVMGVYAHGAVRIDPAIGAAGDLDTAVVVLRHENGCITTIDNSRRAVYGYDQRVEAFGSNGMVRSDNPRVNTSSIYSATGVAEPAVPYFFIDRYLPGYIEQWKAFVRYVREGGESPVGAADGRAPLVIGLAAWRSVHEQRPVAIAEIA
jgi:myo-inositol 2-dehydrogenase/D-chiro-inositol 1-dehydrogenase